MPPVIPPQFEVLRAHDPTKQQSIVCGKGTVAYVRSCISLLFAWDEPRELPLVPCLVSKYCDIKSLMIARTLWTHARILWILP